MEMRSELKGLLIPIDMLLKTIFTMRVSSRNLTSSGQHFDCTADISTTRATCTALRSVDSPAKSSDVHCFTSKQVTRGPASPLRSIYKQIGSRFCMTRLAYTLSPILFSLLSRCRMRDKNGVSSMQLLHELGLVSLDGSAGRGYSACPRHRSHLLLRWL